MSHMNENPRLTSVVFRLNRDRLESLKELSKATRIRQSEYLREAISDLLEKYDDQMTDALRAAFRLRPRGAVHTATPWCWR